MQAICYSQSWSWSVVESYPAPCCVSWLQIYLRALLVSGFSNVSKCLSIELLQVSLYHRTSEYFQKCSEIDEEVANWFEAGADLELPIWGVEGTQVIDLAWLYWSVQCILRLISRLKVTNLRGMCCGLIASLRQRTAYYACIPWDQSLLIRPSNCQATCNGWRGTSKSSQQSWIENVHVDSAASNDAKDYIILS